MQTADYPKIELHVHLEGTVRAPTLREIAKRNDYALPEDLESLYSFRDFRHFIEIFELTAGALSRYDDFRQVVVDYAAEAAVHGAVYLEAIFAPGLWRGLDTDEVFTGYCDGAAEARELHGVEVRLTPDIPTVYSPAEAETIARYTVEYRNRGVVGLGIGGLEYPSEPFERAFAIARAGGVGSVPHAGELAGAESVRTALEGLAADRIRHGIRAVDDAGLVRELAARSPTSAPEPSRRSPSTRCRGSSPRASSARSRPTTPQCSTPTSPETTRRRRPSASTPAPSTRRASPEPSATPRRRPGSD